MAITYLGGGIVEGIKGTAIPASTGWTLASGFTITSGTGMVVATSSTSHATVYDLGSTVSCTDSMVIDYDLTRTSGDYYDHPMLMLRSVHTHHNDVSSEGESKIMLAYWANGNASGDTSAGWVGHASFYDSGSRTELGVGHSSAGYVQPADGNPRYYRFYIGKAVSGVDETRKVRASAWTSDAYRTAEGSTGREFDVINNTALGSAWSSSDDLRYLVVENRNGNQAKWTLSNLKIWNVASTGVADNLLNDLPTHTFDFTDVPAVNEKATITNVPIGTRFEETDSLKVFRRANSTFSQSSSDSSEDLDPAGAYREQIGQRLEAGQTLVGEVVTKVSFWIAKASGNTTGTVEANIREGDGTLIATNTTATDLDASELTASFVEHSFEFPPTSIDANDMIMLSFTNGTGTNKLKVQTNGGEITNGELWDEYNNTYAKKGTASMKMVVTYPGWKEKGTA